MLYFFVLTIHGQCPTSEEVETALANRELAELDQVLQKTEHCFLSDSLLGEAFHRLGILFYLEDNLEKAVEATSKALAHRQKALAAEDLNLGKSNHNLGVFHKQLNQFQQAVPYFQEAARIYEVLQIARAIDSRRELASTYLEIQDYGLAQSNIALAVQSAKNLDEPFLLAESYLDFGRILIHQKKIDEAIDTLKQAEQLFTSFGNITDEQVLFSQAACFLNLANALDEKGAYQEALEYYQSSRWIGQQLGNEELIVKNGNNIGIAYQKLGDFKQSEAAFRQVINLLDNSPNRYLLARSYDNLGTLYQEKGQYEEALAFFHQAIRIVVPGFDHPEVLQNPSRYEMKHVSFKADLLVFLSDKALAWKQRAAKSGNQVYLIQASQLYQLADELLDLMRFEHQSQVSKLFWRQEAKQLYADALEVAYLQQDPAAAFYFMEKSKSVLLLDALVAIDAKKMIPDSLANRELLLQKAIQQATLALSSEPDNQLRQKALIDAEEDYGEFLGNLEQFYPAYYNLRYAVQQPDLQQTQAKQLRQGLHMVHYFSHNNVLYVLNIGSEQRIFKKIERTPSLNQLLNDFRAQFKDRSTIIDQPTEYTRLAYQLFQTIYEPLWEGEDELSREVIIIPDGDISYVPFDALLYQSTDAILPGSFPYLLHQQQVRYTYSALVLEYQQKLAQRIPTKEQLLFLAPFTEAQQSLPALPFSQLVLDQAQQQWQGQFLKGAAASSQALKMTGPDYSLIHLSTHALAGQGLTPPNISFADTIVSLQEIYTMALVAKLVILSACETGVGDIQQGEGVINLARGFAYSGATGLITSLWKVNDAATANIFNHFYQALNQQESTGQALHLSKQEYLNNQDIRQAEKSPYFWSSFTFWGNDQLLQLEKRSGFQSIILIPITAIAVFGVGGLFEGL